MSTKSESWGTRVGLILAMAGNAVGLGNFLRFPVQAVNNGGGAFIIPYLVCFLIMGIPLLWIEWSMGRFGGRHGNHSTPFILDTMARNRLWKYFGVFGIFTNIAVAAYYCYIESWTLMYVFQSIGQTFSGMESGQIAAYFGEYVTWDSDFKSGIPYEAVWLYLFCLALNTWILSKGLSGGVEKVATFGMPLLIIFGAFLAIKGLTLGDSGASAGCTDCDAYLALDFLWTPDLTSLADPKVWLAAAGQIFFTISVGMGTVHCYAAYVREKDDIALNAMTAGWMNGFVEIVLGASVVIPIAAGYLGLDWLKENIGFSMAFQTMPYLFGKWGTLLGTLAGFMWFGLLFFAGITSSLAMGTPWMGFMRDEFNWDRKRGAISFGLLVAVMGLPTVFFFNEGVFDEYDYWAGTVALVVFALAETILFAWIFGMTKGWDEITRGADIKVPRIYRPIIQYVTPSLLLIVFVTSLITPKNGDWENAFKNGWELDANSILGKITNVGITENRSYFADAFYTEAAGTVSRAINESNKKEVEISEKERFIRRFSDGKVVAYDPTKTLGGEAFDSLVLKKAYSFDIDEVESLTVRAGQVVKVGDAIASGSFTNRIFYLDLAKGLLVLLFGSICFLVYLAYQNRQRGS